MISIKNNQTHEKISIVSKDKFLSFPKGEAKEGTWVPAGGV